MAVDEAVVDVIDAAVASLTKNTNLFMGPMREADDLVPTKAVFVNTTGGSPPQVYNDGGAGDNLQMPGVQIMVRSDPGKHDPGKVLKDEVYAAVRKCTPAGTIGAEADQSAPFTLGQDERGSFLWSMNLTVYVKE